MAPHPLPYFASVTDELRAGNQLGNRNQARGERSINKALTSNPTPRTAPINQPSNCGISTPAIPYITPRKGERKDIEIIKAPAKQPNTAPGQVRDRADIEGVLGRHAELSDDPIFLTVAPSWLRNISKKTKLSD
jgi:hypothetical protein